MLLKKLARIWKGMSVGTRAAFIGGLFTLLAAIVGSILIPIAGDFWGAKVELSITDIALVEIDTTSALDIVFWNKSEVPIAITSLDLILRQPGLDRSSTLNQSTYQLKANINAFSKNKGVVKGRVYPLDKRIDDKVINYPITGLWIYSENPSWWMINFKIPVREEIPPSQNHSIILELPKNIEIISIIDSSINVSNTVNQVNQYPKGLSLLRYLGGEEKPPEVIISATYAENKNIQKRTLISFNNI